MRLRPLDLALAVVGACFILYVASTVAGWPPFRDPTPILAPE